MKTSIMIAALLALGVLSAKAGDKVGNDGGLAISDLAKSTSKMDLFHKILYAYEHSKFNSISDAAGLWGGEVIVAPIYPQKYKESVKADQLGKIGFITLNSFLGIQHIDRGPLSDPYVRATATSDVDGFLTLSTTVTAHTQDIQDLLQGRTEQFQVAMTNDSLVVTLKTRVQDEFPSEIFLRQIKGAIVGIRGPTPQGTCLPWGIKAVDGVCAVYYFYKQLPSNKYFPKASNP